MEQYISKSAVVAEIEKVISGLRENCNPNPLGNMQECLAAAEIEALNLTKDALDSLEVKEVDLDKEYIEEVYSHLEGIKDTADRMTSGNYMHHRAAIKFSANTIAKVLELIGLKALKGE